MNKITLIITGKVQGVFFRDSAQEKAMELGVSGFAENLSDGSLKIVAEGERKKLEEFLLWAKDGPELAKVERVDVFWQKATGEYDGFEVK